jgi:hypothetical protein
MTPEKPLCEVHQRPMIWSARLHLFYCHHCLEEAA